MLADSFEQLFIHSQAAHYKSEDKPCLYPEEDYINKSVNDRCDHQCQNKISRISVDRILIAFFEVFKIENKIGKQQRCAYNTEIQKGFHKDIMGMWRGVQYFLTTSFLFVFGWITAQGKTIDVIENNILERKEDDYVFSSILPFTLIITIFGVITAITKTNPILDAVGLENRFLFEFDESYRSFRVTGASISSSVYGISCAILFMCCCFLTNKRNKIIYLALGLLFINNLLSATRAAMIPFFVGLLIFLVLQKGVTKLSKYLMVGILSITLLFPILPNGITDYFTQLTESIVDVFSPGSGGEKFVGSSVDARDMQISKAMIYLEEKPFFGHGIGYANEVILKGEKNEELLGMESYLCFIGIEYGLVYAVAITVFLISCLMYYINNRKYSPTFAYLGISFIVMYILYLIYAWVGTAWYFMMPVLGYTAKKIYLAKDVYIKSKKL